MTAPLGKWKQDQRVRVLEILPLGGVSLGDAFGQYRFRDAGRPWDGAHALDEALGGHGGVAHHQMMDDEDERHALGSFILCSGCRRVIGESA